MNPRLIETTVISQKKGSQPRLACWPETSAIFNGPPSSFTERRPVITWPRAVIIVSTVSTVVAIAVPGSWCSGSGANWSRPFGVTPSLPPHQVVGAAFRQTGDTVKMMVVTLGQVIRGERSLEEMGGPLKIAQFSGQQASLGWLDFVLFMSLISINLGFINLLPIPLLDGGHLLFYAIEGVRRKPLKPEAQEWAFRTGLAVLLALMIFVTFNDLASFGLFSKLGSLIG